MESHPPTKLEGNPLFTMDTGITNGIKVGP